MEPESQECAGDNLGDMRVQPLLERNLCGRAGKERQAARLDEAHAVVFVLDRKLMGAVLEVPWEIII